MKVEFILTGLLALLMIVVQSYEMGRTGFNTDKTCLCIWCLISLIWCYRATKS